MAKKILKILNTYKSSINIRDDFRDSDKLNSFIPTERNIRLLEEYIDIVINGKQKSLLLSGAYGTGKSYLISVILGLLVGRFAEKDILTLLEKIKIISPICGEKLKDALSEKHIVVFPKDVFKDFKQSITVGIKDAIKENGIVLEQTTLHEAMYNKIKDWKANHPLFFEKFKSCLEKHHVDIEEYLKQINNYSQEAFDVFEDVYPEVMGGEPFFPENAIATIPELLGAFENAVISKGFDGVIYIFDEFGRYLEQNINSVDVKQVQDAAEYCNIGNNSALILITHKDIFQYSRNVEEEENKHEWEKVSGRFRKEHLIYEEQSINQILRVILHKNGAFNTLKKNNADAFNKQIKILSYLDFISHKTKDLTDALYPLNYVSATMLSGLSQKLAQNERTMFSFLCGTEKNSLRKIFSNTADQVDFITTDKLYDYFEENFRYLDENGKQYYVNAKSIIESLASTEMQEKKIIKVLALIYILNQFSILPPKLEVIAAAIGVEYTELERSINYLKNEGLITNRGDNDKHFYKLVRDIDVNVDKEVQKYIQYSMDNFDYMETLSKHLPPGYTYAIKYNDEYKITRYLKNYFIDISNIMNIEKKVLSNLVEDGKIVYLFNIQKKEFDITSYLSQYGKQIIFIQPTKKINIIENIKELEAVDRLLFTRVDIQNNSVVKNEFLQYKQETIEILETKLYDYLYRFDKVNVFINGKEVNCPASSTFQDEIKSFFEKKYNKYISVNYELINKTKLTATIKKARREILTHIAERTIDQDYLDKTGAENSIARIVLQQTKLISFEKKNFQLDFEKSIFAPLYKDFIQYIQGDPKTLDDVYSRYVSNKSCWGLRKGLFSLLLGIIVDKHCEDIYIGINGDEVNVTPELFDKFDLKTDNYTINYIEYTEDKKYFLKEMYSRLRGSVDNHIFEKNQSLAVLQGLRLYIYAQPKLVIHQIAEHKKISKLLQYLSINNSKEFFFKKVPSIYGNAKDFNEITKLLIEDLDYLKENTLTLRKKLEDILQKTMNLKDFPFVEALLLWSKNIYKNKANSEKGLWMLNFAKKINEYEGDSLTAITEKMNGFDFYNWRSIEDIKIFEKSLQQLNNNDVDTRESIGYLEKNAVKLSPTAQLLKSKLQADIKNIGNAVSDEEVRNVLNQLIIMKR